MDSNEARDAYAKAAADYVHAIRTPNEVAPPGRQRFREAFEAALVDVMMAYIDRLAESASNYRDGQALAAAKEEYASVQAHLLNEQMANSTAESARATAESARATRVSARLTRIIAAAAAVSVVVQAYGVFVAAHAPPPVINIAAPAINVPEIKVPAAQVIVQPAQQTQRQVPSPLKLKR
jgi:hypothetical protein